MYTSLKRITTLFCLVTLLAFISCNKDDDQTNSINVVTQDITIDVFENVEIGDEVATVPGTTTQGNVTFAIISESVAGAFSIDTNTGILTVADATPFDFATNQTLLVTVNVSNGIITEQSLVTVNLLQVLVETEDLNLEVTPFPMPSEVLGTVPGTTSHGTVTFEIISESITGAFAIDAQTGELSVLDETLYDPEINPTITAQVKVENNGISALSNITLVVLSDCQVSQQNFEDFVDDLITNQGYSINFTMDTETHQYTFSLSQSATICSIGYQSYDDTEPYLFEIVDQADVVLYSDNLTFSSTMQENVPINPLHLTPGTYTIKRTITGEGILGNIIKAPGGPNSPFPFPLTYNSFMTFESSYFYDNFGSVQNVALPYITLGFN